MRALCLVALMGCASGKLAVDRVDPPSAPNVAPVPIQIEGTGFHLAVTSSLDQRTTAVAPMVVSLGELVLDDAVWQGEQLIAGTVPAGIPEGSYDVTVTIGGKSATLADGYTVANPRPDAGVDAPRVCAGTFVEGHCFTYYPGPANAANAAAACAADRMYLAKIEDAVQNDAIYQLVQAQSAPAFTFFGLNDRVTEGTFVWDVDGSPLSAGYMNFRPGEPNNGGGMYEEDCVVMVPGQGGVWDDKGCDTEAVDPDTNINPFICEY